MSKRRAADISQNITKYFPTNKSKNTEFTKKVLHELSEREKSILDSDNRDEQAEIEKIKTERDEYKKENEAYRQKVEAYEKKIIDLENHVKKLVEENNKFKSSKEAEKIYSEVGIDKISTTELISLDPSSKYDKKFVKFSLKGLYKDDETKLLDRSLRGRHEGTSAITPEKLHKIKRIFWHRLEASTSDENERRARYSLLDSHISRVLSESKKSSSKKVLNNKRELGNQHDPNSIQHMPPRQ